MVARPWTNEWAAANRRSLPEHFGRSGTDMLDAMAVQELRDRFESLKPRVAELRRFL